MITVFCAFVGYLLNAFGYSMIEDTTAILLAFLFEVAFDIACVGLYVIIHGEIELKKPDNFFHSSNII